MESPSVHCVLGLSHTEEQRSFSCATRVPGLQNAGIKLGSYGRFPRTAEHGRAWTGAARDQYCGLMVEWRAKREKYLSIEPDSTIWESGAFHALFSIAKLVFCILRVQTALGRFRNA